MTAKSPHPQKPKSTYTMNRVIAPFLAFFLMSALSMQAQDKTDRPSPPRSATAQTTAGEVTVDYSSPGVKGREIWGELVPYGEVWRTGANEATTITLSSDMKVGGKTVPAGKYSLFTIPSEGEWTVILNSVWDQWGAYNYDPGKDVVRFQVRPKMVDESEERLTFTVSERGVVTMAWEKLRLSFEVE